MTRKRFETVHLLVSYLLKKMTIVDRLTFGFWLRQSNKKQLFLRMFTNKRRLRQKIKQFNTISPDKSWEKFKAMSGFDEMQEKKECRSEQVFIRQPQQKAQFQIYQTGGARNRPQGLLKKRYLLTICTGLDTVTTMEIGVTYFTVAFNRFFSADMVRTVKQRLLLMLTYILQTLSVRQPVTSTGRNCLTSMKMVIGLKKGAQHPISEHHRR